MKMVSIYNPDYTGVVYCLKCFWGDSWDRFGTGQDFDFSRPFFDQFKELRDKTPKSTVAHFRCVNSDYTNQSQDLKNCYLTFSSDASEDCMYGNWYFSCRQSLDCSIVYRSELIYECIDTSRSFNSTHLIDCKNCIDSHFLKDCQNCANCFGCFGLRGKSFCFFNEQLTKEEYQEKLANFEWTFKNIEQAKQKLQALVLNSPQKFYQGRNIVSSTGNYIYNLKNTKFAFNTHKSDDVSYSQDVSDMKGGRDVTETAYNELDYESEGIGYTANSIAMSRSWNILRCSYSLNCFACEDCFGCVSLNKNKYCIFNKQYSREEYLALKEKIIDHMRKTGEWGNFFPTELSMFSYNETVAQEYFPMKKEEVLARGWNWYERKDRDYKITLQPFDIPEKITDTKDSILQEVIGCLSNASEVDKMKYSNCTTAFRITSEELKFYRRMNLPIPRKCFMCRFQDRMRLRNPRNLWHRQCICDKKHPNHEGKCEVEFETSYAPDRPEIVYCESCYKQEVY